MAAFHLLLIQPSSIILSQTSMHMRKLFILSAMALFVHHATFSQKQTKQKPTVNYDSLFHGLKWRNIGPFRGGRANAIAGVSGNDKIYYVGYTGGGVWKTDDGGITWRNISDNFFHTGSIGDIAVANSDQNVIYVGTGEHAVRGVMTSFGDGVYKSNDGGKTWKNIGLINSRHISDIVINPNNSDVVYVAAQGAVHGPNAERGVLNQQMADKPGRKFCTLMKTPAQAVW
jgi:photosystem II stability/assembly factor-like uncharacterized protein